MGRSTESPFTAMFLRPNIFWEKIQDELSSVITLTVSLEIRISQIFPRPGVQMDYSKGEKDHFVAIIKKKCHELELSCMETQQHSKNVALVRVTLIPLPVPVSTSRPLFSPEKRLGFRVASWCHCQMYGRLNKEKHGVLPVRRNRGTLRSLMRSQSLSRRPFLSMKVAQSLSQKIWHVLLNGSHFLLPSSWIRLGKHWQHTYRFHVKVALKLALEEACDLSLDYYAWHITRSCCESCLKISCIKNVT